MIKRLLSLSLAFILIASLFSYDAPTVQATRHSIAGTNLEWSLDMATGEFTMFGYGEMPIWNDPAEVPWHHHRSDIREVVLPSDVDSIGNWAFAYCLNLLHVTIPATVRSIGRGAFAYNPNIVSVTFLGDPPAATAAGNNVFEGSRTALAVYRYHDFAWSASWQGRTVTRIVRITNLTVNRSQTTLAIGASETLTITRQPANQPTNPNLTWISSNPSVAAVDHTGRVTALNAGSAVITASTRGNSWNPSVSVSSTVFVTAPATGIVLSQTHAELPAGEPLQLTATVFPLDTNPLVTWSSNNTGVATVSPTGLVTAVRHTPGGSNTATITARTAAGQTATCIITVTPRDADFFPVTGITHVPNVATVGLPLALTGTVVPSNATVPSITWWSLVDAGTTDAELTGDAGETLTATAPGTVVVRATIVNGRSPALNYTQDFTINVLAFVPVSIILDLPTQAVERRPLTLTGLVVPAGATNRNIEWSFRTDPPGSPTFATLAGNMLTGWGLGQVMLVATVPNGLADGTDYVQAFPISVIAAPARFRLIVQASPASGGTVTGSGEFEPPLNPRPIENWQQEFPITAAANPGYRFDGWSFVGTSQTGGGWFRNPSAPSTHFLLPADSSMLTYTVVARFTFVGTGPGSGNPPPAQPPSFLSNHFENGNFTHISGSNLPLVHITQKEVAQFDAVLIGDIPLIPGRHFMVQASGGNTRLTLHAPMLTNLLPGTYILTVQYRDGATATAMFRVERSPTAVSLPFQDVLAHEWFHPYVLFVFERGLVAGTSSSPPRFSPHDHLTQGDAILVLYRMAGSPAATAGPNHFDAAVNWATAHSILPAAGVFHPREPITRQDFALLLSRYADRRNIPLYESRSADTFHDAASISVAARAAVTRLNRARVIHGRPGSLFEPHGRLTRAEFTAMLQRFIWASV